MKLKTYGLGKTGGHISSVHDYSEERTLGFHCAAVFLLRAIGLVVLPSAQYPGAD